MHSIRPVLAAMSMLALSAGISASAAATSARHVNTATHATELQAVGAVDVSFPRVYADVSSLRTPLVTQSGDAVAVAVDRHAERSDVTGEGPALPNGWLASFIVISLVGYQLRRKHRFLRPQRFTI